MIVRAPGIGVDLPAGWEVEIDGGASSGDAEFQSVTTPRVHIANFPLPAVRGDFGSGAVEQMVPGDVLICLLEEDATMAGIGLYASEGIPRLGPRDFGRDRMQRPMKGQAGCQRFFSADSRAFALYVVLGSLASRTALVPAINSVLGGISISA